MPLLTNFHQKCKEIFVKAYLEEQKHSDIATQLNISVRTVDTQIYKALKIIRDHLLPILVLLFFSFSDIFINFFEKEYVVSFF
jgi:hypothetical protein